MKQPRGLSLRRGLPLLVSSLTAVALTVAGALAYVEVRTAALAAAEARLRAVSLELADFSAATVDSRLETEREVTSSREVQAAVRGSVTDSAALTTRLMRLPGAASGVLLLSADRTPVFTVGQVSPGAPAMADAPLGPDRGFGRFQVGGGQASYWMSIPVPGRGDEPAGWLLQRRTIGDPASGSLIESLIGSGIQIGLGQVGDSLWIDLGGAPEPAPPLVLLDEPFRYSTQSGGEALAMGVLVPGGPWVLLAQTPMERVMARPRAFLMRMTQVGLVILGVVMMVGWWAGRRLAHPLVELSVAADAMAAGDYGRRVKADSTGAGEVARLGEAFNQMAQRVAGADEALRRQLEQARTLAEDLEKARLEAERAREMAQAASKAKSHFLAAMSHEIRTPIHAVMGYTDLLRSGVPDPPSESQGDYLERIERSSRLLISLVDDVLDFSRIESGAVDLELKVEGARDAIDTAVAALQPHADRKGVRLTVECDDDLAFRGDRRRVEQILLNLLSNAVKFTPGAGSVTLRCSRSAQPPPDQPSGARASGARPDWRGPWLSIAVEDTGIGVDAEQMERLFEPFFQGAASFPRGSQGGVGLGLAISRRLANMMSGRITVQSTPGEGSRFVLWLPAAPATQAAAS